MMANRLRRHYDDAELEVHVVDRDDAHVYQPGLLFVPFGLASTDEIVRPRRRQLRRGVAFHQAEVASVELDLDEVRLADGTRLPYDALIVASGARLQPEETEGLTGPGWNERAFTFYTPEGADALRAALARFERGRIVVNLVEMPPPTCWVGESGVRSSGYRCSSASSCCMSLSNSPSAMVGRSIT
jgi:sulfide:quinone oxidoreductase